LAAGQPASIHAIKSDRRHSTLPPSRTALGAFPLATYLNQLRLWQPDIRAASAAEISSARIVFGNCVFILGVSVLV
jgi:hypothetical protein